MSAVELDVIRKGETEQQLVPSISIDRLLATRDGLRQQLKSCFDIYQNASVTCETNGLGSLGWIFDEHGSRGNVLEHDDFLVKMSRRLDAKCWDHLMQASGLWSLMDATARKEWEEKIDQKEVPELTAENIESTFQQLYASRDQLFERGIINVFSNLSWHYKSNSPFRFGKRIIITWLTDPVKRPEDRYIGYPNHRATNHLDDLLRVFYLLDRRPEPDHRYGAYRQISQARSERRNTVETDYLTIKMFRNGNGHVTFKRLDIVECMNRVIAKHYPGALPAQN